MNGTSGPMAIRVGLAFLLVLLLPQVGAATVSVTTALGLPSLDL